MENELKIAASSAALRFLVTQLYMEKFYFDDTARTTLPGLLATITRRDAETPTGDPLADRLLQAIHLDVMAFFQDVEDRLQNSGN